MSHDWTQTSKCCSVFVFHMLCSLYLGQGIGWREKGLKGGAGFLSEPFCLLSLPWTHQGSRCWHCPLMRHIYCRGTVTFVPGIALNPVVTEKADGLTVKWCKSLYILLSSPWTSQISVKEMAWFVVINNIIKRSHFPSLRSSSPVWKCHNDGCVLFWLRVKVP